LRRLSPGVPTVIAAIAGVFLATGLSVSGCSGSGAPDTDTGATVGAGASVIPQQTVYSAALQDDIAVLDRGVLTYTPINRLKTGTSSSFEAVVTDVGGTSQFSPGFR
jgi:hypothetical protein